MACWKNYHTPHSVEEAVGLLARYNGEARMVGGGTDLLLEIQQGHRPAVEALVDPSRIEGLHDIVEEGAHLVIGAGVTHTQTVSDDRIRQHGTCLVESCGVIGGPQVRNVGTLAGNIAHALPAGDGTIGLLALEGEVEISSSVSERERNKHLGGHRVMHFGTSWVAMEETFLGPGKSTIDPTLMMISRMRFKPTGKNEGSAFRRVMRPQGVALPMISLAARIALDGDTIASARVTMGPAGKVPFLAIETGAYLAGQPVADKTFDEAAKIAQGESAFRNSKHRSTSEYRMEMINVQLPKVLAKACERAKSGKAEPEGVGM